MASGVRVNGFQAPLSRDQVTSWILQPLMMSVFVAFVAKLLDRDKVIGILVPTGLLMVSILWAWFLCERRDPSLERKPTSCSLLRVPKKMTRYCTLCCKTSPGLDHHCTWLNTCIADNNYEAFYCLVVCATLQTMLQAVIGILMATIWMDDIKREVATSWHTPLMVLLWIHNAISVSLANSYFLLAGFHTYLLFVGTGTYDFILENGSDGICARLLKCKCFVKSRSKRGKGDTHRSMAKTTPIGLPSSKIVAAPTRSSRGDNVTGENAAPSAAKQREIEQWKREWRSKYGSDEAKSSGGPASDHEAQAPEAASREPSRAHDQVKIELQGASAEGTRTEL